LCFILVRFFDTCPAVSLSDYFRSKPVPAPRELTVEEIRADRRKELLARLDRLNAEGESISAALTEFLFAHRSGNRYFAANLEELGRLPEQERSLRQREYLLNQERDQILRELSELTVNPNESRHVEGKLVTHA
jgi:hypothetical protein